MRLLEQRGLTVDVAANGREALEMFDRERYDAIFMDCQMPELDGYASTREIRAREGEGRHTPIVAMTASTLPGDTERCLAAGMDHYTASRSTRSSSTRCSSMRSARASRRPRRRAPAAGDGRRSVVLRGIAKS